MWPLRYIDVTAVENAIKTIWNFIEPDIDLQSKHRVETSSSSKEKGDLIKTSFC